MSKVKKWVVRGMKVFLAFLLLVILAGGGWWLTQPVVPAGAPDLQEETLASAEYRVVADSALVLIRRVAQDLGLPSVSVAVSVEGEPVWAVALGVADLSENHEAGLGTRYRAGSVSKAMTGLAAAKLVEAGKLDLDAAVRQYVPAFPAKRWEVTLRQLGSHTGGIRHYANLGASGFWTERFSKHRYASAKEALGIFKEDPLLFEPGTDFEYSTHGFTLLSAALETAAGIPCPDLLAELVWNPLGMAATRPDDYTREDPDRAVSYMALGGRLFHIEGADPSYKCGILTTPTDLVRMGGSFLTGGIIDTDLREALFSPRPLADGSQNPQGYALGWRNALVTDLLGSPDTLAVLHHGGSTPGGSSFLLLFPDGAVAAAAMTNLSLGNSWPLQRTVYQIAGLFRAVRLPPATGDE